MKAFSRQNSVATRKKRAPLSFEKRAAGAPAMPLSPTIVGSVFAVGALALALGACRSEHATVKQTVVAAAVPSGESVPSGDSIEPPVHVKAMPAPPVGQSVANGTPPHAATVPTTVVIRPGSRPVCLAGL
jgi:hypothetical protein